MQNTFLSRYLIIFFIISISLFQIKAQFIDISGEVSGSTAHKKAEFSSNANDVYYFKHTLSSVPDSQVTSFRFVFNQFEDDFKKGKILCTIVDTTASDDTLKNLLDNLTEESSKCVGGFNENNSGDYDGIIKLLGSNANQKIGIKATIVGSLDFTASVYIRIAEEKLEAKEQKAKIDESYTLTPLTVVISSFREYASKLLLYSVGRELQMYYIEGDVSYPEKLFSGNILSIYTNPNQVRQKYKNANIMTLLTRPFTKDNKMSELFQFEVKFFPSNYLLDYFVSNDPTGRSKNTPFVVNMTECTSPYYVILNYNKPEKKTTLYIDQIYGKIRDLSVAPELISDNWEEMIEDDMKSIPYSERRYELPANLASHIDVYKVQCEIPLLLNFYYVDETASIPSLDYGHVSIFTLKTKQTVSIPFVSGIILPAISIEVFNPSTLPFVIINDGQNENIISKNYLYQSMPFSTSNPLVIKERGGNNSTRIIIKIGYKYQNWKKGKNNIYYNEDLNIYVFAFPNQADRMNYTGADLITYSANEDDNIKYCYALSIGSPIYPSAENCYRVSLKNPYTLKVLNPLLIYKDYDFKEDIGYYVTLKPVEKSEQIKVNISLYVYDTKERNIEGEPNILTLDDDGVSRTILTAPAEKNPYEFLQIMQCKNSDIIFELKTAYNNFNNNQTVIDNTTISYGTNYYNIFLNIFLETELVIRGTPGNKIFVSHTGIRAGYDPNPTQEVVMNFDSTLNQLTVNLPIGNYDRLEYTVFIGKEGEISSQGVSICDIIEGKKITDYSKSIISYARTATITINFAKTTLKTGNKFEYLVYIEQKLNTKMRFLSKVATGTVGEIKTDIITEINQEYSGDSNIVYTISKATDDGSSLYFSYLPTEIRDVPIGVFRIEFNTESSLELSGVSCAFVDADSDVPTMVEAVEDVISTANPYCTGAKSTTNAKTYNYLFKYAYTDDNKPKRLVIKISNEDKISDDFAIYLRKGNNTYIESTDFKEQKEYGKREEYEKTLMPYIVDLSLIRGKSDEYVSKILFYSQYLELQMYYLDETGEQNMPILFFTGSIMLLYTNPYLAIQKYHTTKLILLSESLSGQEHSILGNSFRFHTKMFRSQDQIEYFQSNNPIGRTLNYPLSIEMNTCTSDNDKYYYILNYNRQEPDRILYLDLIYGSILRARVLKRVRSDKWDTLILNDMGDITGLQTNIEPRSQHIDVVEIQCQTPLLANAYYNYDNYEYLDLKKGNIAIQTLQPLSSTTLTLDTTTSDTSIFASISLYNAYGNAEVVFDYGGGKTDIVSGNTLKLSYLSPLPSSVTITNRANSPTRFLFKLGYDIKTNKDWTEEKDKDIEGKLYSNKNMYVYEFPIGANKKNFTNVEILVKALDIITKEEAANVKFCYSTSLGMPIDVSKENCFRTGKTIQYSLTFINPLIAYKNYDSYIDNYYVTLSPYYYSEYISLSFTENKYNAEKRGVEGFPSILTVAQNNITNIILSLPANSSSTKIFVQLQACSVYGSDEMIYSNLNAYTQEVISSGKIHKNSKLYFYSLQNNNMETEIKFYGTYYDKVFVKHMGITGSPGNIEQYYSRWVESKNTVNILKPILNEAFRITVLVGKKGHFDAFSLCTFALTSYDKYYSLADYVYTFTSVTSDIVTHFVDFTKMSGYSIGTEFDLLVYAVQVNDMKLEVLYNVISGKVGEVGGVEEITREIPNKKDYISELFNKNISDNNYLYYNFEKEPTGDVATFKITPEKSNDMIISKVVCTFVEKGASQIDMISEINNAEKNSKSVCAADTVKKADIVNALVNAADIRVNGKTKLVILIKYASKKEGIINQNNEEIIKMNITIRTTGYSINKDGYGYMEEEELSLMPYVLDLKGIRDLKVLDSYVSKILLYSSTRELQMFYLKDGVPVELFNGNILLIYTNEDMIKEKYSGATTMILLTESLTKKNSISIGETFRFKMSFFESAKSITYYVSPNPKGRKLNNPTSIEMLDCDQPYYYILNYNEYETYERVLHIDTIFGEINSTHIANQLTENSWDNFVDNMAEFSGNSYSIKAQKKYHIDVFKVTCKSPLLLNIYYTESDDSQQKPSIEQGDVAIINLAPGVERSLALKDSLDGRFIYSFHVNRNYGAPDILIDFEQKKDMKIEQNGIFVVNDTEYYKLITVYNKRLSGSDKTKVIVKFGYDLDYHFTKIKNDVYNLQIENRTQNLFAYVFNNGEDRMNYTKVVFEVSTEYDNVKFCYITNLGALINPSLQNCYRVGKQNSYNITVMNPYIMYKDYYTGEKELNYYVSFRTEDKDLNITIKPIIYKYDTPYRTTAETPKATVLNDDESTILTNPSNKEYVFMQLEVCSSDSSISYELADAFHDVPLGEKGELRYGVKNYYKTFKNIKLDTKLIVNTEFKDVMMFIKYTGIDEEPRIEVLNLDITYEDKYIRFNQPILDEDFKYTILIDKVNNLVKQAYTLCSFSQNSKLAPITFNIESSDSEIRYPFDTENSEYSEYKDFDVLILAEQINNGKMMILSDVLSIGAKVEVKNSQRTLLIIIVIILSVILVAGGIFVFLYVRKLKNSPRDKIIGAKQTDVDDIESANAGEKMIESMRESQAYESQ